MAVKTIKENIFYTKVKGSVYLYHNLWARLIDYLVDIILVVWKAISVYN